MLFHHSLVFDGKVSPMTGPPLIKAPQGIEARSDNWISSLALGKGQVSAVFQHSLDLLISGTLINCHIRRDALHPLSLLVPHELLGNVQVGMRVEIQEQQILLGSNRYPWESTILPPPRVTNSVPSQHILKKALGMIRSLGRPSPLLTAWLGLPGRGLSWPRNHQEFLPVISIINQTLHFPALDLSQLNACIGTGDGLS